LRGFCVIVVAVEEQKLLHILSLYF